MSREWRIWEIPSKTGILKPHIESLMEDYSLILTRECPYEKAWLVITHTKSSQEAIGSLQQDCELFNINEASDRFMSCSIFQQPSNEILLIMFHLTSFLVQLTFLGLYEVVSVSCVNSAQMK